MQCWSNLKGRKIVRRGKVAQDISKKNNFMKKITPTSGSADSEKRRVKFKRGKARATLDQATGINDIIIKFTHIARVQTHAEILVSCGKEKARAIPGHAASEKLKFVGKQTYLSMFLSVSIFSRTARRKNSPKVPKD
ncbi:hypothetical protein TNCV_757981 [Trichonephila clavipes]|nr:hypothetical protein TNCV_757981 [Trichonephila clavipes]